MSPDEHLAFQVVRAAYTAAQDRAAEDGTPFDITARDLEIELIKHAEQLDAMRLKRIVDLMPAANERLRRKLVKAAVAS